MSSIFINFLSHLQKNRASRDSYFVCPGERSAVKNLKRLGRQCPRKRCQQIVGNASAWCVAVFEAHTIHRTCTKYSKQLLNKTHSPAMHYAHCCGQLISSECYYVDRVDPKVIHEVNRLRLKEIVLRRKLLKLSKQSTGKIPSK